MSLIGYNGRSFKIMLDGTAIAAVQTKTTTRNREAVDVTTDDDTGNRRLLPAAGTKSLDVSVEGVVNETNLANLQTLADSSTFADITIENPDGSTEEADDGFFVGNIERSGEHDGHVAFTMELQSSGAITVTPAT